MNTTAFDEGFKETSSRPGVPGQLPDAMPPKNPRMQALVPVAALVVGVLAMWVIGFYFAQFIDKMLH